jgi:hypothetical protein
VGAGGSDGVLGKEGAEGVVAVADRAGPEDDRSGLDVSVEVPRLPGRASSAAIAEAATAVPPKTTSVLSAIVILAIRLTRSMWVP